MSESNIDKYIVRASNHLICDKSYIEKDYYTTSIICTLSKRSFFGHKLIFSGGTSLSKGYKVIQRFSGDVDFIIPNANSISRNKRKDIKYCIIEEILKIDGIQYIHDSSANKDGKVSIEFSYNNLYAHTKTIRCNILVELFFEEAPASSCILPVSSYLCEYRQYGNDTTLVLCRSLEETLADKFSALTWRTASSQLADRLTRHLYDIHLVYCHMNTDKSFRVDNFKRLVKLQYTQKDALRSGFPEINTAISLTLEALRKNKYFMKDYNAYVKGMIFGENTQNISFSDALVSYKSLADVFIS